MKADCKYRCKRCMRICIQFDVKESFCYLSDKIYLGRGCELIALSQTRAAWGKFRELIPLLTSTTIYLAKHGQLYSSCVRSTLIHTSTLVYIHKLFLFLSFACLFSVHNTISLSCHERVCLIWLHFERYFSHHQAKRSLIKHTCLWFDKLIVLLAL